MSSRRANVAPSIMRSPYTEIRVLIALVPGPEGL